MKTHMRTLAIAHPLNLLNQLPLSSKLLKVNEGVGPVRGEELALVIARVDANDAVADRSSVLDCEVAQSTARAGDDDPVARLRIRLRDGFTSAASKRAVDVATHLLQRLPHRHARAKNRSSNLERQAIGNGREMTSERDGVLLERAVDGVA